MMKLRFELSALRLYCFCVMLFAINIVMAQSDRTLSGVQVVGTKSEPLAVLSAPQQKMDSVDFLHKNIGDLAMALRKMTGTDVRDYGGAGGLKTVSVHGLGASHTVVTYDGVAVSDTQNGMVDLSRFNNIDNLTNIRLSVADDETLLVPVRNLGMAVLKLNDQLSDSNCLVRKFSLTHGAFGKVSAAAKAVYSPSTRWGIDGTANFFYGRNDYPFVLKNGKYTSTEHRWNSRMQATSVSASAWGKVWKRGVLNGRVYYYNNHRRLPGPVIYYNPYNDEKMLDQNAFAQMKYHQPLSKNITLLLVGKYDFVETKYTDFGGEYPGGALRQNYWQREAYTSAGLEWRPAKFVSLAYASDYVFNSMNSNLKTDNDVWRNSWLQSVSARFSSKRLSFTMRGINSKIWNGSEALGSKARSLTKFSPSTVLAWRVLPSDLLIFNAFYKELFRAPTFTESYYYHYGSQNLLPETTRQMGGGATLHYQLKNKLDVVFAVQTYFGKVRNKIVGVPINLFVWRTVNLGEVKIGGFDANLKSNVEITKAQKLFLTVSYSLQRAEDRTGLFVKSKHRQLVYMPQHSGNCSLSWDNPWLSASVSLLASSQRWATLEHLNKTLLPRYSEVGISVYRNFQIKMTSLFALIALDNVFNKQYEIVGRYPMPGRAYRLNIGVNF